jgi:hypothetical protein
VIEETAQWLGRGVCQVAALTGQFKCSEPAALAIIGYVLLIAVIVLSVWLVIARPE